MFKIFENPIRITRFYLKSVNVKEPYFWFVLGWGGGLPVHLLACYDASLAPADGPHTRFPRPRPRNGPHQKEGYTNRPNPQFGHADGAFR